VPRPDPLRTFARLLGFPRGLGELLPASVRPKFAFSLAGSVLLSALDMLGVLAMLPLMQFIAGQSPEQAGALGFVYRTLGRPEDEVLLAVLAALVAGAFVLKDVVAVLFRRWQLHFMADQEVRTSTRILEGYLVGPYHWHLVKNTADKVWTVEFAVQIGFSTGISSALALVTEAATITLILGSLLLISPPVTLGAVVYFGLGAYLMQRLIRPRVLRAGRRNARASRITSRTSLQALGAAKEIKLRRAHAGFVDTYRAARSQGAHARASSTLLGELPKYALEILFVLGVVLLALYTGSTDGGGDGLVLLGVFVAAGTRILPSIVRLLSAVNGIRFAREPLHALVREHRNQRAAIADEQAEVLTDVVPRGRVSFEGVSFAYRDAPDAEVLSGVDLVIETGRSIALVGSSGAGKSTLVDLLLGLHQPTRGRITAGGLDIRDNLPGWQRGLAVVPQDVYLLDDTLRHNIAFDEQVDPERLADAVTRAQLDDLVASLPEGLDTTVGERGTRLSGGQRQRIGIARALYRQPQLLVLDEATSALDNETERRLTETIESLSGAVTVVVVAHRLSTVRHCDELVFLSRGRVAGSGSFDEVAAANAEFAHLVRLGSLVGADPQAPR
jgi:ABC-type multidrug transport system fused ATPase/permease subunit